MAFSVGGASKPGQIVPQMNVTPLVDVVLVLLIIFMVVTPLLTKQAWINVPSAPNQALDPPPTDAPPPVVVTVDAAGTIQINAEKVDRAKLAATVQGMLNARSDKVVFFDAASDTPYEKAVEILDLLKGGGMNTIAVLSDALPAK
jgi:biopolymer transport protein ExbD